MNSIQTPLGPMVAAFVQDGLCLLDFADGPNLTRELNTIRKRFNGELIQGSHGLFSTLEKELAEYFIGSRKEFSIPLRTCGTPFQERVWSALRKIPYGEKRSYKDQAIMIGSPQSVRAVAGANGKNLISIIIPCHRVIGYDGTLTGYGGGLWRKKYLLELEAGEPEP